MSETSMRRKLFVAPDIEKSQVSVSYHPDKSIKVKTFRPRDAQDLATLTSIVTEYVWSPIIYRQNLRLKQNYMHAWVVGVDVDDGMPINDAIDLIKDQQMAAIVGPTRSHQKEKDGKPACDRYRVILPMSKPCTDRELFEYNAKTWSKMFGGDISACDGGRLFRPCAEVSFINNKGIENDWLNFPKDYVKEADRCAIQRAKIAFHKDKKTIPNWILFSQKFGVPPGGGGRPGRHLECYKIGAVMTELGYSVDEITDFLCSGKLVEIGAADVRRQVEWGAARALGNANPTSGGGRENDM